MDERTKKWLEPQLGRYSLSCLSLCSNENGCVKVLTDLGVSQAERRSW